MSFLGVTNIQNTSGGNNITTAQIKNWTTRRPFNHQTAWSNQRVAISAQVDGTLWQFPVTKISRTSILVVYGWLHFGSTQNGQVGYYGEIDGNRSYRCTPYSEIGGGGSPSSAGDDRRSMFVTYFPDITKTGVLNMKVGWAANDGGANNPGTPWNPHYGDGDTRIPNEQGSLLHIWEVEPV